MPLTRRFSSADIYVPVTTTPSKVYTEEIIGNFNAIFLAETEAAIPAIKAEFAARLSNAQLPDPKTYNQVKSVLGSNLEDIIYEIMSGDQQGAMLKIFTLISLIVFLFMLLPTLNLVNLNISRILERASEIGVRKAFGATSLELVGQFLVENLVLTSIGAVFGFIVSGLILRALNLSGIVSYSNFTINYRVFFWGIMLSLVFGIISGAYPAFRMSRLNPVQALKGGLR